MILPTKSTYFYAPLATAVYLNALLPAVDAVPMTGHLRKLNIVWTFSPTWFGP
jgi:hypothetical protein